MKTLATCTSRADGTKVFTLGPIKHLEPFDRFLWRTLYARLGWHWVYRLLWRKYVRRPA